jgi:hypothetical protein
VDSRQVSQITTGAMVIVVGLVLLGGEFRVGLDLGRLWPLIFLVVGLGRFFTVREDGHRGNGTWFVLLGLLFLLNNFRIVGLGDTWPLFIIVGGFMLIFGRGRGRRLRGEAARAGDQMRDAARARNGRFDS